MTLDSETADGGTNYTWHHQGEGGGARVGASYAITPHVAVSGAITGSFAETTYDDDMGVGWLAGELTVTGSW